MKMQNKTLYTMILAVLLACVGIAYGVSSTFPASGYVRLGGGIIANDSINSTGFVNAKNFYINGTAIGSRSGDINKTTINARYTDYANRVNFTTLNARNYKNLTTLSTRIDTNKTTINARNLINSTTLGTRVDINKTTINSRNFADINKTTINARTNQTATLTIDGGITVRRFTETGCTEVSNTSGIAWVC
jgi:hypothetical protein